MFAIATTNQHGQIVIPAKMRKQYGITPGKSLKITPHPHNISIEVIEIDQKMKRRTAIPIFKTDGKPSNLAEEMNNILYS